MKTVVAVCLYLGIVSAVSRMSCNLHYVPFRLFLPTEG